MTPCCHCHTGKVTRPRGLCWKCYYMPGIRDRYKSDSKFSRLNSGSQFRTCRSCGGAIATCNDDQKYCSTCYRPESVQAGYFARIALYASRAALGLPLFPEAA